MSSVFLGGGCWRVPVSPPSGAPKNVLYCMPPLRQQKHLHKKKVSRTHTPLFLGRPSTLPTPTLSPPPLPGHTKSHTRDQAGPGHGGCQRAAGVPQVGQAGVVPQGLGEGLCSFIADVIAPHPEGRGRTEKVSARYPIFPAGAQGWAVHSVGRRFCSVRGAVAWGPMPTPAPE